MVTEDEGRKATAYARAMIEAHVLQKTLPEHDLPVVFKEKRGVFVTLHTHPGHELRGCIGIPHPVMSLGSAIKEAAISSTRDPRFFPVSKDELDAIIVEITILTVPEQIIVDKPEQYPSQITIGKDGLILEYLGRSGLLLPQVPVEYDWDAEEFLTHLCLKAGLPADSWFEPDVRIFRFSGQIFSEQAPYGPVEERSFHES